MSDQVIPGLDLIDGSPLTIDYISLEYVSSQEHLLCPICQLPFHNPYSTSCGHTFCYACLKESLRATGNKCPMDRSYLSITDMTNVYPAPVIVKNLVDEIRVRCLNKQRGCDWTGPRWAINNHLETTCEYVKVQCGFTRHHDGEADGDQICNEMVERKVANEANECLHTRTDCSKCGESIEKLNYEDHLDRLCNANRVTCSDCESEIAACDLQIHKAVCEKKYVKCDASEFGCDWKGSKAIYESVHARYCPLLKMSFYAKEQDSKMASMESEIHILKKGMSQILDSVVQGQVKNLGYGQFYDEVGNEETELDHDHHNATRRGLRNPETLNMEGIKTELSNLQASMLNSTQSFVNNLMADNWRLKDELNIQKQSINGLRQQLHFLIVERRRRNSWNPIHVSPAQPYYSSDDDDNGSSSSVNGIKL